MLYVRLEYCMPHKTIQRDSRRNWLKASITCQWTWTGMLHRAGGWSWVLWLTHGSTLGRISSKWFLRHRKSDGAGKSELSWPRSSHLSSLLSTPFPKHRNYRAEGEKESNHIQGPKCRLPTAAGLSFEWTLKCWLLLGKHMLISEVI